LGIPHRRPHSAASDAEAAAELLVHLSRGAGLPARPSCGPFHRAWTLPSPVDPVRRRPAEAGRRCGGDSSQAAVEER
jgi:hypothetical protein